MFVLLILSKVFRMLLKWYCQFPMYTFKNFEVAFWFPLCNMFLCLCTTTSSLPRVVPTGFNHHVWIDQCCLDPHNRGTDWPGFVRLYCFLTEEAQRNHGQAALAPPSTSHLIFNGLGEYSLILIRALANVTHTVAWTAQAHRLRVNECREGVHSISLRGNSQNEENLPYFTPAERQICIFFWKERKWKWKDNKRRLKICVKTQWGLESAKKQATDMMKKNKVMSYFL